ncbi:glycosyltransferase [Pseudomonas sp. NPDC086278]|uniref:glycosyltransferase n=1 Tax=Pseudomonas sp. NPDC086278 TaxID=3390646 RepID=UPI003CFEA130
MSFPHEANPVSGSFEPLVTIVIPVYNGANFLADAIHSALAQTYEAIEIIVVNDGSNDGGATERVAQSFGGAIRYLSKENGGVASALNLAIQEMSGEYFSWLSHDDLYFKEKIATQIAFLSAYGIPRTIVYSDYSIFTDNRVANATPVIMLGVHPEHFRYWITTESALHGCSLLIPRSAFDAAGFFNERLRTTQDYELWFRMAVDHRFVHIPKVLVGARSHAHQDTHKIADLAFEEAGNLYLGFVKAIEPSEVPGNTPSEIGASYLRLASGLWQRGFYGAAEYCAGMARKYGASFVRVLGAQLVASSVRIARRLARTLFSPQARQAIRRFVARMLTFHRGR